MSDVVRERPVADSAVVRKVLEGVEFAIVCAVGFGLGFAAMMLGATLGGGPGDVAYQP